MKELISRQVSDDRYEEKMRDAQDINFEMQWVPFREDAISQVKECFENNGDLLDLLNTLDFNYDPLVSLENWQINDIVKTAVKEL